MRVLMTTLAATLFSINMFAQHSQQIIDSIGLYNSFNNYNWSNSINQDSIYQLGEFELSSISVPGGTIEPNGFRMGGMLYTMRIKVPGKSNPSRMPMPYLWDTKIDSIDRKIIFPPLKKE